MNAATPPTVLVIDDLRTFNFPAIYARTSAEGLALLHHAWNEIWLDHDLGGDDHIGPVVDRLCEDGFNGTPHPALIVIHSSNPAAGRFVRTLERYGYTVRRVDAGPYLATTEPSTNTDTRHD